MNPAPLYTFQRGDPIFVGRQVVSGDPTGYVLDRARLKKSVGQTIPPASAPVVAEFEVEFAPAADTQPARWLLFIPASISAGLAPGFYAFDARFTLNGEPAQVTEVAYLRILESVSG